MFVPDKVPKEETWWLIIIRVMSRSLPVDLKLFGAFLVRLGTADGQLGSNPQQNRFAEGEKEEEEEEEQEEGEEEEEKKEEEEEEEEEEDEEEE
ncbi:hypothetical protein PoB_004879700 [Plakobranchus ocellatus]|uniref:Uncharacterized protein n=1 Tax=Plakobranchus ocellatus TaxID=259542 RepID=A0AAV4BTG7_9GAST|nr:hypothetical protein PoB_004879700 [Plakobranchus ocellatus]